MLQADRLEPRLTPARLIAYVIAGAVYAWALLLVGIAVLLAAIDFPNPFGFVLAFIPFSLAFFMRPRFGKPPKEDVLERDEAPTLYALADEVADALETPRADDIVVNEEFNASWAILGLRRRRVLTLGLPLLSMLAPQERVAIIAHELAHGRNGDSSRGLFVGSAVRALEELYAVFAPDPTLSTDYVAAYELGLFDRITNVFMWIVSRPILGVLYLELHLLLQDAQRAEYLADALGAEVAGTAGAVGVHEKSFLEPTFHAAVQRASRGREGEAADVFAEAVSAAAGVPDRERERRRRVARLEEARLDATHPPSARRLELLERRGPQEARVTLTDERSHAIDQELMPLRAPMQRLLVEEHRDALYARYS
jgi:Zn-dependent protease with chaperone function